MIYEETGRREYCKKKGEFQYFKGKERREEMLKGGKKIFQIKEMKRACF